MSKRAHFDVELGETGQLSKVFLDGRDIGHQIDSIWISTGVSRVTKVEVRFIAPTVSGNVSGEFESWDADPTEEEE